jgi:hypothetical protein
VFQATVVETGEVVAIKKVLQDKRFKVSSTEPHFYPVTYRRSVVAES